MQASQPSISLINGARTFSGIGRYAKDTFDALENRALLISLAFSREDFESGLPGLVMKGIYPPITSGWFINTKLQALIFRNIVDFYKNHVVGKKIVHYVDPYVFPFLNSDKKIVSILDVIPLSDNSWAPPAWIKYARKCLNAHLRTEFIITCSNKVKKEIEETGFAGKIDVVYPYVNDKLKLAIPKNTAKKSLGLPEDKFIVLSISSASQRKNLTIIKEVVEKLGERFMLVRVGSNIGQGINFEHVDDGTLNKIYRAADVLLFPTLDEGFGYPIVEAMANGLPVVTTDLEITREVSRGAVILSEPTVESYVTSIRDALDNAQLLSSTSLEASKWYTREKYIKALLKVYDEV